MHCPHTCKAPVCATFLPQHTELVSAVTRSHLWQMPRLPLLPPSWCPVKREAMNRPGPVAAGSGTAVSSPSSAKSSASQGLPPSAGSKRGALEEGRLWGGRKGRTRGAWLRGHGGSGALGRRRSVLEEVWPWGAAAAGDPPWGRGAVGSKGQRRTRSKRRTGTTHRPPPSACGALPHLAEGTGRKGTPPGAGTGGAEMRRGV